MGAPIELFCCYSREDEDDLKKLFQQFRALERANLIHVWYDRAINPGENWEEAIHTHLERAQMILLMVSASFIASDQCYDKEMPRALARHESGQARVLPVLLHPCDWKITPLGRFPVLPTDSQPISLWPNQNSALLNVIEGVKRVANELQVEILLKAGLAHYDAERYDEALAAFEQALSLAQPQEEPIVPLSLLARLYQGKGDVYFIKKNPSDETWKNTTADALTNYEKALHYDNSLLHSLEQKGRALFHLERYNEAISSLEEALTRGSLDPDVHFCKFETLRRLHRTDEALTFYEQVFELWPSWGEPHRKAAQLFEDEGRFEQALVVWERVISLMPDQSEGYLGKARVLEYLEHYADALEVYEQTQAMQINTPQLSLQKGFLLELLERDQEALHIFDEIVQSSSKDEQEGISGPAYLGKQRVHERLARKARTRAQALNYAGHYRFLRTLPSVYGGHSNPATSLTFSPDSRFLASSYHLAPPGAVLWDLSSGRMLQTFENINPGIDPVLRSTDADSVAFSPDGRFLVGSNEQAISFWELSSGKASRVLEEGARMVALSPDNRLLAGCVDKAVKLWDLSSGKVLQTFQYTEISSSAHDWSSRSVAFSPDGRFLAGVANYYLLSGAIVLWDVSSRRVSQTHDGYCHMAFSPDGRFFAAIEKGLSGIRIFDLSSGTAIQRFTRPGRVSFYNILFSLDGQTFISCETDYDIDESTITVWDLFSKNERQTIKLPRYDGLARYYSPRLALSHDGYTLAGGIGDGTIKLWRLL